jgi:hypothetical protein
MSRVQSRLAPLTGLLLTAVLLIGCGGAEPSTKSLIFTPVAK